MVRFKSKDFSTMILKAYVDDVHRFNVMEADDFQGGWFLISLCGLEIRRFATLCEVETYIEEMDK